LARFTPSGALEFRGRKDDRIKIRGNRIEIADIERALAGLPGISRASAVAAPRDGQEPMLVAFVVLERSATWTESRLRHAVAANLPIHMVPSRFVFVEAIPLSSGGKIDRDALRAHASDLRSESTGEAPRSETETLLADIWAETLDLPQVGRDDDFFMLGGDSLKGAIVAAQVHSAFAVEIDLGEIAGHSALSALAKLIESRRTKNVSDVPALAPVSRAAPLPISLAQERMHRVAEQGNLEAGPRLVSISGPLDAEIFKDCLRYLIARHESLRTTFDLSDGDPLQVIHCEAPLDLEVIDLSTAADAEGRAASYLASEVRKPIDPTKLPTSRHRLLRMSDNEHRWLYVSHPAFHDAWSRTILSNELAVLYEAKLDGISPPLPTHMPLQYADFAVWQRAYMAVDRPVYRDTLTWWKDIFSRPIRPVRLPFRRSRPLGNVDPRLGIIDWRFDGEASETLNQIGRAAGATFFAVRLTLFVALVADLTGRSTVVLATVFGNRRRVETRNIVGHFSNLMPLVFSYDRRQTLQSWITTVRDRLFETEKHADIPYEQLNDALRAMGLKVPGARILFALPSDHTEHQFGGLAVRRLPNPIGRMPRGCQFFVDERNPENCRVDFDANRYDHTRMRAMVDRYVRLLEIAARHPDLTIGRLVAMSSDNSLRRAIANYASRTAQWGARR